jgi:hypothetical protein
MILPINQLSNSVAGPGCLSRILIFIHPGSNKLTTATKEKDGGNLLSYLFCSHQYQKIVNYFSFEQLQNFFGPMHKGLYYFLPKELLQKNSKIRVWDPGTGIRDPDKTYPGCRGQKGTGSATLLS